MNQAQQRKIRGIIVYSVFGVLGLALTVYLVWALRSLILPFIVGGFLAYLFRPLIYSFKGSKWSRWTRVTLFVCGLIAFFFFSARLINSSWPSEKEQIELQVRVQYKVNERYESLMGINAEHTNGNLVYGLIGDELNPILENLNELLDLSPEQRLSFIQDHQDSFSAAGTPHRYYVYFLKNLERRAIASPSEEELKVVASAAAKESVVTEGPSTITKFFGALSNWLIMPLIFLFLLFDKGQILKHFVRLIPNRYFELSLTVINEVDLAIGRYVRGTLIECSLVGGTLFVGLYLIGIEFNIAILIGLVAGLSNAIPFLGPFIGLVVGMAYALIVEDISPLVPLITTDNLIYGVLVAVIVAQIMDNAVFQPIILGNAVNLHPIAVIIGVMGGSIVFGFAGMLLAIPTIVISKVVIETLLKELKSYRII